MRRRAAFIAACHRPSARRLHHVSSAQIRNWFFPRLAAAHRFGRVHARDFQYLCSRSGATRRNSEATLRRLFPRASLATLRAGQRRREEAPKQR